MSNANFSILVDFAAGGLVLASVLIVWRRDLRAIVRLLAWQGAALAAIPLLRGIRDNDEVYKKRVEKKKKKEKRK